MDMHKPLFQLAQRLRLDKDETHKVQQKLSTVSPEQLSNFIETVNKLAKTKVVPTKLHKQDAVLVDPHHHEVIAENEYIRILWIEQKARTTVAPHVHQWPSVMLILKGSHFVTHYPDGSNVKETWDTGIYELEGESEPYAYSNCGQKTFEALRVELKRTLPTKLKNRIQVKKIKKNDLSSLSKAHAIIVACGLEMYNKYNLTHWYPFASLDKFKERICHADLYGVYNDDNIIATFNVSRTSRSYYKSVKWKKQNAQAVYVGNIAVLPSFQGKGIGSWCMQYIETISSKMGIEVIRFDCVIRHPWLINFYKKIGYEEVGNVTLPEPTGIAMCLEKGID